MKKGLRWVLAMVLVAVSPAACRPQVHPTKEVYVDWESWTVTTPDQIALGDRFEPFRAVWSRQYRNGSGELRQDRVVLVAEELSWYGRPVVSFTLHDAGALDAPDTNARTTSFYLDRETLALVRGIGPVSGTPEDYNVIAVADGRITTTRVDSDTGETSSTDFATDSPVFGSFNVDHILWAALGLRPDTRTRLDVWSPAANAAAPSIIRVIGQEEVELPGGERRQAWVVERPIAQPDNARMHHFRILDRPPYLASRHVVDLDSQETSFHFSLLEWELLGQR